MLYTHKRSIQVLVLDHARHLDALHEAELMCLDWAEPVDRVVLLGVRGRVAKCAHWVEAFNRLNTRRCLHILRFIDDNNGPA